jgi:Protein of unknown function (DUF779)/Aldehyde dehydrogenase family
MRIFQEETFGPVVAVTSFTDDADALKLANDALYGLGAGVWTRDGARAYRVDLTAAAADLLRRLAGQYGPLMFHQSGGCCDGSTPMCYPDGEFLTGDAGLLLGRAAGARPGPAGPVLDVEVATRGLEAHPPDRSGGARPGQRLLRRGPGGRPLPDQVPPAHEAELAHFAI